MGRYDDIDSPDYNDTNMGIGAYYDSPEEKQIARLEKKLNALTAERDRLAAEISATNAAYATLLESHELILDALTESDATLDRLRAVGEDWIRGGESLEGSYEAMTRMYAILNPENET